MKGVFEKQDQFFIRGRREHGFRGWPSSFHLHAELIYVVKGTIKTVVDGKEHTLLPGELSVIFPYVIHSYEDAPDAEALVLMIAPEAIFSDHALRGKLPRCHHMDGRCYEPMLSRAVELIQKGWEKTAQCYMNAVLGEFLQQMPLETVDESRLDLALQVLSYCSEHFDEAITLQSVSRALNMSQSHISKILSQKFKCSFRGYINQLRIEKAKNLLRDPRHKVLDVMYACGFENQSSFNRIFREYCGISPREYRKNLQ